MANFKQTVTGKQWLIATSVFATTNKNRFSITYGEFLDMLEGMEFTPHPRWRGAVRPPQRYQRLPQGNSVLSNRPLHTKMSYRVQAEMKRQLRDRYGMKLAHFFVDPPIDWEHPADPNNPVPIPPSQPRF
ncbi:hypothetical protein C8T65DRAFT_746022 [Cerioporus squamosus]|nr:hypothetical protein C8T65DRAFT_746022 [Cerioporus squamosus]